MTENNLVNSTDDYIVVWLDKTIETNKDNRDVKALIQQKVRGRLLTFIEPDACINQIFTEIEAKRIVFIVSNEFGPGAIEIIHSCPQIFVIYVYCTNERLAKQWTQPYSKVGGIFKDKRILLDKISDIIGVCEKDRELPMSVFHLAERQTSLQNLTKESANFMWYQSILHVLRLMARYCNSKTDMINECRASYYGVEIEQKKIDDFEQTYTPTKALWWYTYDSCVYRLLNKALRTQNTEIIFKFRFFINDLHNEIVRLYQQYLESNSSITNHHLTVYRGQRLSMNEVDLLRRNVNELISMNSFLSATRMKQLAEIFADTSDQSNEISPLQSVVFIIDICDMTKDSIPFAFIQNYSCCYDEEEVLFSICAIFKVQSVTQHDKVWHVHLQLSKQQNELLEGVCEPSMTE